MNYSERYYNYQTKARGLLDRASLMQRFEKVNKWYWARFRTYLPTDVSAKCLDVPCGYGNFLYFLKSKGYQNIQGFDLDENQVELARLLNLPAETKDVFSVFSELNEPYDLISSLDFIEHLSKDVALKFIDECHKSLRQGGVLILRTPCADGPFGAHDACNDLTHEWSMTSNVLRTILEMCGFTRVQILDERPQPTNFLESLRWLVFFPSKLIADCCCMALGMRPPKVWSRSMVAVAYK